MVLFIFNFENYKEKPSKTHYSSDTCNVSEKDMSWLHLSYIEVITAEQIKLMTITFVLHSKFVTRPAKIGHVGSRNLTTFQIFTVITFYSNMVQPQKFQSLFGFTTLLTEFKD